MDGENLVSACVFDSFKNMLAILMTVFFIRDAIFQVLERNKEHGKVTRSDELHYVIGLHFPYIMYLGLLFEWPF